MVPFGTAWARLPGLLGCAAGPVVVSRSARGKPLLDRPFGAACSLAHRAGLSLVAAAWHRAIGADLELVRDDLPLADIADGCFSPAEAAWLRALPEGRRALAFTLMWTVKEAVLKLGGQGIAHGLADPAVPGDALAPLLAGAPCLDMALPGLDGVQLRQGLLGSAHAVACIAAASPAKEPSATADSSPLPDR